MELDGNKQRGHDTTTQEVTAARFASRRSSRTTEQNILYVFFRVFTKVKRYMPYCFPSVILLYAWNSFVSAERNSYKFNIGGCHCVPSTRILDVVKRDKVKKPKIKSMTSMKAEWEEDETGYEEKRCDSHTKMKRTGI
jgi:hypothetical protein